MKKIYCVTGPKGSGKSTAIAYFLPPSRIHQALIVDTEDSMSDILENLDKAGKSFGGYIRMYEYFTQSERQSVLESMSRGNLPWVEKGVKKSALLKYWEYFVDALAEKLKGNEDKPRNERILYLGVDTIEPIEAAMTAWVEENKRDSGWSGEWTFGRRETEGVRPLYEGWLEGVSQTGVEDFGLASHLKPVWDEVGGKVRRVANKIQIGGRIVVLSRLSSQMWWLAPNVGNPDGAPAAIRIKARKGKTTIDGDSWVHQSLLPRRIPHFTWEDVRRYEETGCDPVNPPEGEVPTQQELDMISEFLNEEQMKLMVLGAQQALEEAKSTVQIARQQAKPIDPALLAQAQKLKGEGKSDEEIEQALLENFIPPLRPTMAGDVKTAIEAIRA